MDPQAAQRVAKLDEAVWGMAVVPDGQARVLFIKVWRV